MKSGFPKRRFPRRHVTTEAVEPQRPRISAWVGRALWFAAGVMLPVVVALLSQGPDAIRRIPEIPKAVTETINSVIDAHEIDRGLTGSWEFRPDSKQMATGVRPVRLELTSDSGRILGEFYSPAVSKWTIYDMALVEGSRNGALLHLTVFDFIHGKRTRFAELDVRLQEASDGILDHIPAPVNSELAIDTAWQKGNALPRKFSVHRVTQ